MPDNSQAEQRLAAWRLRIDRVLNEALLPPTIPASQHLLDAMRYAALSGGKRIRPLLVYATGSFFDVPENALDQAAIAVELIQAYSLVHDDLPSMDNDALRRGQPTAHIVFGEATAILAGDALQSLAFEMLAKAPMSAELRIAMLAELAGAAGAHGMCGGQALDIEATGATTSFDLTSLEQLHALKTGALLRASIRLGAIAGAADAQQMQSLDRYANALGLAFQIRDDLLDIEGTSNTLGKAVGKDAAQGKATFPSLIGIQASRERLESLAESMQSSLKHFDAKADCLRLLAQHVVDRNR